MTMLERYGRRYPCIIDRDIFGKLPKDCKDYLAAFDFFLFYDDEGNITLASWDTEDTFKSIDALTAYVKEEIRLAADAGYWNSMEV